MCDPISIGLMVAGAAASVVGNGMTQAEATKNASRIADARNRVLKDTLAQNKIKSDASRASFGQRITDSEKAPAAQQLNDAQGQQSAALQANMGPTGTEASLAGDAPQVVQSAFANAFQDAATKSKLRASATAKLGGYGAVETDNSIGDRSLRDNINVNNDAVRGNLTILPHLQDFAEFRANRPSSGMGQLISSLGSAASSYAGSRGQARRAPQPSLYG